MHSINFFLAHWITHLDVDRFIHFSPPLSFPMSQCIHRGIIIVPIDLLGRLKSLRLITSRSRKKQYEEMGEKRKITIIVSDLMWAVCRKHFQASRMLFSSLSSTQLRDRIHTLVNVFYHESFFSISKSFGELYLLCWAFTCGYLSLGFCDREVQWSLIVVDLS